MSKCHIQSNSGKHLLTPGLLQTLNRLFIRAASTENLSDRTTFVPILWIKKRRCKENNFLSYTETL